MKIAYIGNFDPWWSTETHVAQALENIGCQVSRIPEQRTEWAELDIGDAELVLWTRTAGFDPPDLNRQAEAIRRISVPVVGYHLDRWWGLDREVDIDRSPWFTETDFLCTADGGHQGAWRSKDITHYWFPPAILESEARIGNPQSRFKADVAFVGNLVDYGHAEWRKYRRDLYDFLRTRYHGHFQVFPGRGRPQIRGQELADLYASVKVIVGDSCLPGGVTHYWSDRIPETTGRGGFLIHPGVEGLTDEHPHLWRYKLGECEALGSLIDVALESADNRAFNATANREHTLKNHTYEQRMRRLLSML